MLTIEKQLVGSIPCFVITPKYVAPKADILLYHGWGSHAEKQCFRGRLLAGFGYRVIVPEIALHGERGICAYESSSEVLTFLEVLYQSIQEANVLVKEGLSEERPKFIVGHSLGGMITLGIATRMWSFVDGFVAMNSTADWSQHEKMMQGVFPEQPLEFINSDEFREWMCKLAPYAPNNWMQDGMKKPVLLTNGALDQTLPAAFNESFCCHYSGENVQQIIFPDAGHVVTDGMLAEVIRFIEKCSSMVA